MALKLTSARAPAYQALSTDEWPTEALEGATLYVVDEGTTWVFHDGMWVIKPETALVFER